MSSSSTTSNPMKPMTYKSVAINSEKLPVKNLRLLVKDESILETLELWSENEDLVEEETMQRWVDNGLAFLSTPEGTREIHKAELKQRGARVTTKKSRSKFMAADIYVNAGTVDEPLFIRANNPIAPADQRKTQQEHTKDLKSKGKAFGNLDHLFNEEKILKRAEGIATKLKNEFPEDGPEWAMWTKKTTEYNTTSLSQVMAEYFRDSSIGDVGGAKIDYRPMPGYVGTLAPGEMFEEDAAFADLPEKVLHPWPAMQQFQWHVRWPPGHPMIPPPVLWIGLCNMYTENMTETMLKEPNDEVVGGLAMEPKDAVRIAKYSVFGKSYIPSEQLEHGSNRFDHGHKIPWYFPDHGPTVPESQMRPPLKRDMKEYVDRWADPYEGLELNYLYSPTKGKSDLDHEADSRWEGDAASEEQQKEEDKRKALVEKMFQSGKKPTWMLEGEGEAAAIDQQVEERIAAEHLMKQKVDSSDDDDGDGEPETVLSYLSENMDKPEDMGEEEGVHEEVEVSQEVTLERKKQIKAQILKQIQAEKELKDVIEGNARGERPLIKYAIETTRDMQGEIHNVERNLIIARKEKGNRRRVRKRAQDDDEEPFVGAEETEYTEQY